MNKRDQLARLAAWFNQPSRADVDDELMQGQYTEWLAENRLEPPVSSGQSTEPTELGITLEQAKDNVGWRVSYVAPRPTGNSPAYIEHGMITGIPAASTDKPNQAFVKFDGDSGSKACPLDRLVLVGVPAGDDPRLEDEFVFSDWLVDRVADVLTSPADGQGPHLAAVAVLRSLADVDPHTLISMLHGTAEPAAPTPPLDVQAALVPVNTVEFRPGDRVVYQLNMDNAPLFALVMDRQRNAFHPVTHPALFTYSIRVPYLGMTATAHADQLRPYPLGAVVPENTGEADDDD